jgi:hypothetical protein
MRKYVPRILLWLFVIDLGIAFGAGLYESRVVIPRWETFRRRRGPTPVSNSGST